MTKNWSSTDVLLVEGSVNTMGNYIFTYATNNVWEESECDPMEYMGLSCTRELNNFKLKFLTANYLKVVLSDNF